MHPYKKQNQTLRQALIAATLSTALVMVGCGSSSSSNDNKPQAGQGNGNSNNNSDNNTNNSSPLFSVRGDWAIMDGDITSNIVNQLNKLVTDYPQVKTIVMANVPGSSDDEMNLKAGLRLRELGLNTYLPPGGEIASGGVDLFLAGKERFAAPDVLVGVHSWAGDGVNDASTLPRDHASHKPYLDYYKSIGIDEDFYWFTIEAANAEDIHWMTAAERTEHGITTRNASDKELNMITDHASTDAGIKALFNQYTWVETANKKAIHIFAADQVSQLQMAKARAVMQHYLTNVSGHTNKDKMSSKLGDNQASLFMFNRESDSEAAFEGPLGQSSLVQHGQDLYATEVFVEGSHGYLKRSEIDARDATYEEVLHLMQGHGMAPAEKALQDRTVTLANQALADKTWNPTQEDVNEWRAETDDNGYDSTSYEYLAAAVEGYYGIWGYSDAGLDGYVGTKRNVQQQRDPQGYAFIEEVWPSYITTTMPVSSDFAANETFTMQYDANLEYTSQSQYLSNVTLTGNNNSHILANALNNTLKGNAGDNRIDAAAGSNDVVVFNGLKSEYQVSQQGVELHIEDTVSGRDGHDVLLNVEFIRFSDGQVSVNDL